MKEVSVELQYCKYLLHSSTLLSRMQIIWHAGLLASLLFHCAGLYSQAHPHGHGALLSRGSRDNEPLTRGGIRKLEKERAKLNQPKTPLLWTRDFGNCMNDPAIEVQSFSAAYHAHNMTVSFSFKGNTTLEPQYVLSIVCSHL